MKSVNDIIKEQVNVKGYVSESLVRQSWRAAAEEMIETDEWFKQQCLNVSSYCKHDYGFGNIKNIGLTSLQEILFAISMLFIDSGKSDAELAEIMKQKTP